MVEIFVKKFLYLHTKKNNTNLKPKKTKTMELKSFKIRVTEKQSVYVQNEVFRNGGGLNDGDKSIEISSYLFYGEFFDMVN